MVSRANVYLKVKYGDDQSDSNTLRATEFEYRCLENKTARDRELITRREVADLGNINSATVRALVEYLKATPEGYDSFVKMGLAMRPPRRNEWVRHSLRSLVRCLRIWSIKQVRTHFDQLRCQGLITAERDAANGPWRYELPDELCCSASPYENLPSAEELTGCAEPIDQT